MLTYKGGNRVGKGTYWNLRKGLRVDVVEDDILPGDTASTFLRMPVAVMLLSGPFIGLLYAILMPFIGIVSIATLARPGALPPSSVRATRSATSSSGPTCSSSGTTR